MDNGELIGAESPEVVEDGEEIGDEDGDTPIQSSTFGMLGNDNLNGPTAEVMEFFRQTGSESMTEGEFYVNWLMGRLI